MFFNTFLNCVNFQLELLSVIFNINNNKTGNLMILTAASDFSFLFNVGY